MYANVTSLHRVAEPVGAISTSSQQQPQTQEAGATSSTAEQQAWSFP